jgi:hypothetical protein
MKSLRTLAFFALAGSILAGCGGSANGFFDPAPLPDGDPAAVDRMPPANLPQPNAKPLADPPPAVNPPTTIKGRSPGRVQPTSDLRTLQPGDFHQYYVTGRLTTEIGGANPFSSSVPITGTATRTVTTEIYNGILTDKVTNRLVYKPAGGIPVTEIEELYYDQDADGNLRLVARRFGAQLWNVDDTGFYVPGVWANLVSSSGVTHLINDATSINVLVTQSDTLTVTGTQDIATGMGVYGTWKTERSRNSKEQYTITPVVGEVSDIVEDWSSTENWTPIIGAYVFRTTNRSRNHTVVETASPLSFRTELYTLTTTEILTTTTVR